MRNYEMADIEIVFFENDDVIDSSCTTETCNDCEDDFS